jgi:hypothetical protein
MPCPFCGWIFILVYIYLQGSSLKVLKILQYLNGFSNNLFVFELLIFKKKNSVKNAKKLKFQIA